MGPLAQRYFEGLQAAEIWIVHKPYTRPWVATPPEQCGDEFVQYDSLVRWQTDALVALQTILLQRPHLPLLLIGISEGAEILPILASQSGDLLMGLVLLSASGLDPVRAFQMQLEKMGRADVWAALRVKVQSALPAEHLVHGRSLRYWRDLWGWALAEPLFAINRPVLQVWGDADELIPSLAYQAFAEQSRGQIMALCSWRWPGANHALRTPEGMQAQQQLWLVLDRWARHGKLDCPASATR